MNKELRVRIDEETFRALVRGEVVTVPSSNMSPGAPVVKVALADIGWDRMYKAVDEASP
jgi:hypothetical protein